MNASDRLAPIIDIAWGRMPASEIKELRAILEEVARLEESHAELLEAAERNLSWLTSYPGGCTTKPGGPYEQTRAAIAKAKGGKQ